MHLAVAIFRLAETPSEAVDTNQIRLLDDQCQLPNQESLL